MCRTRSPRSKVVMIFFFSLSFSHCASRSRDNDHPSNGSLLLLSLSLFTKRPTNLLRCLQVELAISAIGEDDLVVLVVQDQFRFALPVMGHGERDGDQIGVLPIEDGAGVDHRLTHVPARHLDAGEG